MSYQDLLQEITASKVVPLQPKITINMSQNTIHVSFNRFPGDTITSGLKKAGFRWDTKTWFADDCETKRAYLRTAFDAWDLEPYDTPSEVIPEPEPEIEPEQSPEPPSEPVIIPTCIYMTPEFALYREQIAALTEHLNLEAHDLQLLAIKTLYEVTFSS